MNLRLRSLLIALTLLLRYCDGFIVSKEVPELLPLLIPNIKKGTDSRLGFGFRFGEHADFQTIIEFGPQKYTKPIGKGKSTNDESEESDTSKRMVSQSEHNKVKQPNHEVKNQWIHNWANEMKSKTTNHKAKKSQKAEKDSFKSLFGPKDQYPIPTASIIKRQLQHLHSKRNEQPNETADQAIGTLPSYMMEAHVLAATNLKRQQQIKSDLMDVSLDD